MGLNSGIILSAALVHIAQCTSVVGLQQAAQALSTVLVIIKSEPTKQSSLMMPRTFLSLYSRHKRRRQTRRGGYLLRFRDMGMDLREAVIESQQNCQETNQ